ncbi:hypothetical protein DPMN_026327 [Dreissena polymorpha]|uniref:Uncharacterized protein n=1 Tax=Dreissena polymorpha TaxID=45954 RepID=A0A9D4RE65_DREPO|nr:hypothetical protein DPMN_026327 [Dreissena polymorpha]
MFTSEVLTEVHETDGVAVEQHAKRIINNLVDINARSVLIPAGVHTRGHANCYIVPLTTVNAYLYQFSFFPTRIRL